MSDEAPEAHFAALRDRFAARIPSYGDRLRQARGRFANDGGQAVVLELKTLSHELAGTAGMFGFPDITEAALTLEKAVDTVLTDGCDPAGIIMPLRELIREVELAT